MAANARGATFTVVLVVHLPMGRGNGVIHGEQACKSISVPNALTALNNAVLPGLGCSAATYSTCTSLSEHASYLHWDAIK